MNDGPLFESEIWQYYQASHPGQVKAFGTDVFNGSVPQLTQFKINANATYPLLLACGDPVGSPNDTNLVVPYFERDNFVVIDRQGVIRYHANDHYFYGNRYHRDELRAAIDAALADLTGVPEAPVAGVRLAAAPNPFTRDIRIEFTSPFAGARARVQVLDLAGRRVAGLRDGPAPSGTTGVRWDGRADDGADLPPGVYLLHVEVAGSSFTRRLVRVR